MDRAEKIGEIRKKTFFRKGDVAVYAAALLLVALFTLLAFLYRAAPGDRFSVIWRGETIFTASLSEDAVFVFTAEDGAVRRYEEGKAYSGYNVIEVSGGQVSVREADCPDHTCEFLDMGGSSVIVCVPHELRIEIEGAGVETDV